MLKFLSAAGICLLLATGAQATTVDFEGPYGSTGTFDDGGGNGSFKDKTSTMPAFDFYYKLVGSNSRSGSGVLTSLTFTGFEGIVNFATTWLYNSYDRTPNWDPFGLILNGTDIQLTDNSGGLDQVGSYQFTVSPSDTFSFYIDAVDDKAGKAKALIFGQSDLAPIPLPAALPMAAAGLMLLGGMASRRKKRTLA
ncbi:hypothetical protein [Donghicola sp. XS_ASV15]|uniref:hypothetical protein n=1 Tax=Donghicola sp. XS_ASV15 TaxID=3241295 RepID=UPI00351307C7